MTVFDRRQMPHKPDAGRDSLLPARPSQRLTAVRHKQSRKESLSHKTLDSISTKAATLIETIQKRTLNAIVCSEERASELCERQKDVIGVIQKHLHISGQFARFCPGSMYDNTVSVDERGTGDFFSTCRLLKSDRSQAPLNAWLQRTEEAFERSLHSCETMVNDFFRELEACSYQSPARVRVSGVLQERHLDIQGHDGLKISLQMKTQHASLFDQGVALFGRNHAIVSIEHHGNSEDIKIPFLVSSQYPDVSIVHDVSNRKVWSLHDGSPTVCDEDRAKASLVSHQGTLIELERMLNRLYGARLDALVQDEGTVHVRDSSRVHQYIDERRALHQAAEAAYCGLCNADTAALEAYMQRVKEVATSRPDSHYGYKTEVFTKEEVVPQTLYEEFVSFCKRYELRPSDPRYCQQGGTVFTKDVDSFQTAIDDGAHLICCRNRESGDLAGFLMVYPPESHKAIHAHIQKQVHWYGPASYVSFVAVDPELSAQIFQLLQVRMMCEAYTSNIYAGQVATSNVPSLLTNGYGSGAVSNVAHTQTSKATVPYQGYNDLVDMYCGDNFTRFGSGEMIVEESQDANVLNMVGFIRGLSVEWKERIAEIAPERKEAFQEVRYLQAGALPGTCKPSLPNLLRLWRFSQQEELRRTPGFGSSLSEGFLDRILDSEGEERTQLIARMHAEARLLLHEGIVKELSSMGFWDKLSDGSPDIEERERISSMLASTPQRRFDTVFSDVLSVFSWQGLVLDYLGDRSSDRTKTEMDLHFGDWPMLMRLSETLGNSVDPEDIRSMMYEAAQALPLRY